MLIIVKKEFNKIVKDIKSLKVQGAENVALAGVRAIELLIKAEYSKVEANRASKILIQARSTEPMLRNCLRYILHNYNKNTALALHKVEFIRNHVKDSRKKITEYGARKILNGSIVYTHCHSSTVTRIILEAARQGKKFEVHNTETRPKFQGRKTAIELAKAGISVKHYVDSAARLALKKADIAFLGADAITSEAKVINKIGSELISEAAERYQVPVYCCSNSWKFDADTIFGKSTKIEERPPSEVWDRPPKNVTIMNYAFERVSPELITAIISELGIYRPQMFMSEFKRKYPEIL